MLPRELQNFHQRPHALADKFAGKPGTSVQFADFRQCHLMHFAPAGGRAVQGRVVNGHKMGVPRQMQVVFDERYAL